MSSAKALTSIRRATNYQRQTGRAMPTPAQTRRMNHKSRKRLGFADDAWSVRIRLTAQERFRQRHIFAASLINPKAHIMITGTGA